MSHIVLDDLRAEITDRYFSNKNFSTVFKDKLDLIERENNSADPRGLKVKEQIFGSMEIDPLQPIANFKSRPFNWKYFAGELAWYLKKDRDVNYIGNFSNFWSTLTNPNSNEINSNYGSLVFNEQLEWVVDSLVKDKNSRQAIAFFNRPDFQFEGNKDFVCTMYANFFIRDNKLHMKIQMRSNDMFYGLTFDAPFFSFLHQTVYHLVWQRRVLDGNDEHLELGTYYHFADNLHFYERHFDLANNIINEESDLNYILKLKRPFFTYVDGEGLRLSYYAKNFIKEIDKSIEREHKQSYYRMILSKYFELVI